MLLSLYLFARIQQILTVAELIEDLEKICLIDLKDAIFEDFFQNTYLKNFDKCYLLSNFFYFYIVKT